MKVDITVNIPYTKEQYTVQMLVDKEFFEKLDILEQRRVCHEYATQQIDSSFKIVE